MKNNYSVRHLMAFLSFFCWFGNLFAQTMPTPQSITPEFVQNFSTLAAGSTTYPPGFQGWTANAGAPGTSYNTALTATNQNLRASSTANTNSGGVHNYNGKIGFLDTNSLDAAIGFAFVATNSKNIQVKYDAMVIRNPYNGTTNLCIYEMALQYRIGTTGPFITIPETAYLSDKTVPLDVNKTEPINSRTIKTNLPATCNNQPIVQIRWIAKQNVGGGARPSFAIDDLDIREDIVAPVSAVGYPKADNILSESFDFSDKLDEIGKTYYVLVPGGSAAPTAAQIKAGQDANSAAALQSGFLDVTDITQVYTKTFSGLTLDTNYTVFSVTEDIFGNLLATPAKVDASILSAPVPSMVTTVSALDFGFSETGFNSDNFNYQIQGTNITTDVTVTATGKFTVSKDGTAFGTSVVYAASDFASGATPTVYARFTPDALGSFSGQIENKNLGAATKTVALSGTGIDPYTQGFNDANVLTNSGWTQYNVAGTANKWITTTVARNINSGAGAVIMNGYSDSGASKDWLISPKLRLDNTAKFDKMILLSYYSRKFYAGTDLKLMVSTNYDGKSNPETATWVELDGKFPTITGTYVQSQYIKLEGYKTSHTYLAWVYETTAGGTNNAAEWSFDDFAITNETGYVDANPVLDFGDVNVSATSGSQAFLLKAEGHGDITLTAPADYQLSLNDNLFQSSVVVSAADAVASKKIYARFVPSVKKLTISGVLTVTGTALNKQIGSFTGSSIPKADTFDVVTYNLEFFGTDVKDKSNKEFGPIDDALQIENVAKVMNKLNADVYVVQEVSDEPALDALVQKISVNGKTFDKVISPSWSYSFKPTDPNFPPQKLVVIYNTQTATVKNTRVMFKDLYDQIRAKTVTLNNYPSPDGDDGDFFSSGRLPYMVQIETNVGGVKKLLNLVDLHARANSGSDMNKYNMRKYDAQVLKDSLDRYYANSNLIILGDYNDDVDESVISPNPSTYKMFVDDKTNYTPLTLEISKAGAFSYLSSNGFLDHIMISNELNDQYIENSIAVYDPRNDIANYTNTTSDHGPVIARFELKPTLSVIDFETKNGYFVQAYPNPTTDVVNVIVKTATDKKLKLKFYDVSGHLIGNPVEINATQDLNTTAVPVSYLQSGIYFYTLTENNKIVYKGKIIKK
jgi:hypothetical protein